MRPMVKKVLPLLLTLALASAPLLAKAETVLLFDQKSGQWSADWGQKVASIGDTLYIARSEGLYSHTIGDEASKQLMDFTEYDLSGSPLLQDAAGSPALAALFSQNTALYALELDPGGVWRFDPDASAFVQESAFDPAEAFGEDALDQSIFSGFCMEGDDIYYIALDPATGSHSLMMLDTASGKGEFIRSGILLAAPYAPGMLLVGTGSMGRLESLSLMDVKTGRLEEKLKLTADYRGLAYDPATDTAYLWRKGEIHLSRSFAPPEMAAHIPILSAVADGALLPGGRLALPYQDGVRIFTAHPAGLAAAPLRILGHTWELPMEAFSAANPDITFQFIDTYPESAMDLVMHMGSGDSAADVYVLSSTLYSLDALYEKGYFADLQDNEPIRETLGAMYPYLKDVLTRDGHVMALPFKSSYTVYGYNPRAFEEVGLSGDDVPKTYGELLDFIGRWAEEYAQEYPSMSLFGQDADIGAYRQIVAGSILEDRMYDCLRRGEPATYDTPQMRALLEKFIGTDFSVITPPMPEPASQSGEDFEDWPRQLFLVGGYAGAQAGNIRQFSYMPLALSEDTQPVVPADTQILLINPYTQNYDTAVSFLEFVADNLPGEVRIELMPGENEPLRDPGFNVSMIENNINMAKERLEKADEADRKGIQEQLDHWLWEYDNRALFEWLVSRQSIAALRALDPYFVLQISNPMLGMEANEEITNLIYNRFLDGQLSAGQFVQELDQKLRMIALED